MAEQETTDGRHWVIAFLAKVAPTLFIALIVGSIGWIGSNSMQTNVSLAVLNANMDAVKEQLKVASADRYTGTQANADKSFYLSEISHLKESDSAMRAEILLMQSRLLDLERKVK